MLRKIFSPHRDDGFTLLELLVVVIVIGVLAAIALPIFIDQARVAVDASVKSDVRNTVTNVNGWRTNNLGLLPNSAEAYTVAGGKLATSKGSYVNVAFSIDGSYTVCGYNPGGKQHADHTHAWRFDSSTGKFAAATSDCTDAVHYRPSAADASGDGAGADSAKVISVQTGGVSGSSETVVIAYDPAGSTTITPGSGGSQLGTLPTTPTAGSGTSAGAPRGGSYTAVPTGDCTTNCSVGPSTGGTTTATTDDYCTSAGNCATDAKCTGNNCSNNPGCTYKCGFGQTPDQKLASTALYYPGVGMLLDPTTSCEDTSGSCYWLVGTYQSTVGPQFQYWVGAGTNIHKYYDNNNHYYWQNLDNQTVAVAIGYVQENGSALNTSATLVPKANWPWDTGSNYDMTALGGYGTDRPICTMPGRATHQQQSAYSLCMDMYSVLVYQK